MKKIILPLLLFMAICTSAFSNYNDDIGKKALSSFYKSFSNAKEVKVEEQNNLIKVSFVSDGQKMFAYYQKNGEQVAVTRYVAPNQLPISLSSALKEKTTGKWLTDLFEVSSNGESAYYATVADEEYNTIYQSNAGYNWIVFKKTKREVK